MQSFIISFGTDPNLLGYASISSILGFILTIFVMIKSRGIAKTLLRMELAKDYNENRNTYIGRLKVHKNSILEDDIKTRTIVHDILEDIFKFEAQYNPLLSRFDKIKIWITKRYLMKEYSKINFDIICNKLDYLIGRFHKKEEE